MEIEKRFEAGGATRHAGAILSAVDNTSNDRFEPTEIAYQLWSIASEAIYRKWHVQAIAARRLLQRASDRSKGYEIDARVAIFGSRAQVLRGKFRLRPQLLDQPLSMRHAQWTPWDFSSNPHLLAFESAFPMKRFASTPKLAESESAAKLRKLLK